MKKIEINYDIKNSDVILLEVATSIDGDLAFRVGCQIPNTCLLLNGSVYVRPNLYKDKYCFEDFRIYADDNRFVDLVRNLEILQDVSML